MQQVDSAKLVLGDAVRAPEIVGLGALGWIVVFQKIALAAEYILDFLLRQNAFRTHTLLSASHRLKISKGASFSRTKFWLPRIAGGWRRY